MLQSMGSQRVGHYWGTEVNWGHRTEKTDEGEGKDWHIICSCPHRISLYRESTIMEIPRQSKNSLSTSGTYRHRMPYTWRVWGWWYKVVVRVLSRKSEAVSTSFHRVSFIVSSYLEKFACQQVGFTTQTAQLIFKHKVILNFYPVCVCAVVSVISNPLWPCML